ncbi:hypothetical protein [Nitratiruptor sp. SB155-2]|uniref:hypothetical protein n=1 Tax=Nitratiruptor sp. (strain SB155-2) TaxID=387092 RepID=UPI0002EE1668|nr:hypothetical protein [Nitratiruptor sp. SB155-2]
MDKEKAMTEFKAYEKMRLEMYDFLERYIPKDENGQLDFSKAGCIPANEVFDRWFALDYQARKIRGIAVNCLGLKGE